MRIGTANDVATPNQMAATTATRISTTLTATAAPEWVAARPIATNAKTMPKAANSKLVRSSIQITEWSRLAPKATAARHVVGCPR